MRFAGRTATAFAVLGGLSNVGSAVGPYLVGVIRKRAGLEKGISLIPLFSLALAVLALLWYLGERAQPARGQHQA